MIFTNRTDAGRKLVRQLLEYKGKRTIVLALARGGVPVGFEIAKVLKVPLDVIIVRKLGSPSEKEFGIGAIAEGGVRTLDLASIDFFNFKRQVIDNITKEEEKELKRRIVLYRSGRPLPELREKTVILVDDGLATGLTARAAIDSVKKKKPKQVICAAPVCAFETAVLIEEYVDDVVCLSSPSDFEAVGKWYEEFDQVTDEEVISYLQNAKSFITV